MIAAGVGWRSGCGADEIVRLVGAAAARAGVRPEVLAVPAFRLPSAAVLDAAGRLGLALVAVERAALLAVQASCPTRSARALAETGVGSVAEGCALAAAGDGAALRLARIASAAATCAIASGGGAA